MPIIRFRVQQLRILKKWAPSAAAVLPWPLTRWLLVNEQRSRRADKTLSAVLMNAEIPPASAQELFLCSCCCAACLGVCMCSGSKFSDELSWTHPTFREVHLNLIPFLIQPSANCPPTPLPYYQRFGPLANYPKKLHLVGFKGLITRLLI